MMIKPRGVVPIHGIAAMKTTDGSGPCLLGKITGIATKKIALQVGCSKRYVSHPTAEPDEAIQARRK